MKKKRRRRRGEKEKQRKERKEENKCKKSENTKKKTLKKFKKNFILRGSERRSSKLPKGLLKAFPILNKLNKIKLKDKLQIANLKKQKNKIK